MSTIDSAAATGLPAIFPALAQPLPRRSFLAGLTKLPLIGGSVALLGQPYAVAEPVTRQMLEAYKTWLHYEYRHLAWDMAELPDVIAYHGGTRSKRFEAMDGMVVHIGTGHAARFHPPRGPSAIERAALVLSTVGCDWHDEEAPPDWRIPLRRA